MENRHSGDTPGIYTITCAKTGRVYIGQSIHIQTRWTSHRWHLARGIHGNSHLQRAWAKYGAKSFVFAIAMDLSATAPSDLLQALRVAEAAEMAKHNYPFNLVEVGEVHSSPSAETRARQGAKAKARWADPAYKERVRATQLIKAQDQEFQERRGAAISAGKSTPEYKAKRSAIALGLWEKPGFKDARAAERTANWKDPEYRQQQKESRKAAWADPEVRARRIAGLKAAWIKRRARDA
jgi:group I intron endonuclease